MRSRPGLLALLCLGACSFPTEGVPVGAAPDAETCVAATETCDGADNDCDGTFDEGFASGDPCDGPDADLCADDAMVCDASGGEVCGDTSGDDNVELCNGPDLDEDCDGMTDEGYGVGNGCDGDDNDVCTEGVNLCADDGLGVVCNDATGDIVELCDNVDQDCDGNDANGFNLDDDEANCGECELACTNGRGSTTCSDGTCTPTCDNGAADCNTNPNDGCELVNTSPACTGAPVNADADVDGDDPDDEEVATLTGTTERFMRIRIRESVLGSSDTAPTARLVLTSGAGTDFDLYVYCSIPTSLLEKCALPPLEDVDDTIEVGRPDQAGVDRTFDVIAEVRYDPSTPSTTCAQWTLTITGNNGSGSCGGI